MMPPSTPEDSNETMAAAKASAEHALVMLSDAADALTAAARPSRPVDKRRTLRFRKGAAAVIPQIGTLLQSAGLDGAALPVDAMLANLEHGKDLAVLVQKLEGAARTFRDLHFHATTSSWRTALQGYVALQRLAVDDAALAESLKPVAEYMAYRHPLTAEGEATKATKKAAAKLEAAKKRVAKRAERAKAALALATETLGEAGEEPA